MSTAQEGSKVKVMYTGKFKDSGETFDSNVGGDPLEFKMGEGMVIAGFERAVIGLSAGQSATVEVSPEEGYGEVNPGLSFEVERTQLPPDVEPQVGMTLQVTTEDGGAAFVHVTEVGEEKVTLDGNHPLAGKALVFEIEVVEVA